MVKFGRYPLHHGVIGAIRSLGRAGVPVYGVHEDRLAPAGLSRYLSGRFVWEAADKEPAALLDGLAAMAGKIGGRPVLLCTDDRAAVFVAEHDAELRELFRLPVPPSTPPRLLADKLGLAQLCLDAGVASPEVTVPASRSDVAEFARRSRFPVMVKLAEGSIRPEGAVLLEAGLCPTSIVRTAAELLALYDRVDRHGGGPLLLQAYVPGGEDWFVHAYCDERSEFLVGFTGVKLRSYPPGSGGTTLGVCRANEALLEQAQVLCRKLGYRGILDMDWRLDHGDGRYNLLDFNPRVGAQFRVFVDDHGVDVVRAMHLDLTGLSVPAGGQPEGRAFLAEQFDVLAFLAARGSGGLTLRQWWASTRGHADLEFGWLDRGDPLPAAMLAVRSLLRAAVKGQSG